MEYRYIFFKKSFPLRLSVQQSAGKIKLMDAVHVARTIRVKPVYR